MQYVAAPKIAPPVLVVLPKQSHVYVKVFRNAHRDARPRPNFELFRLVLLSVYLNAIPRLELHARTNF